MLQNAPRNTNTFHLYTKILKTKVKLLLVKVIPLLLVFASILSIGFTNINVRAATVNFVATIPSSGTGPFDADDTAGNDSSGTNSIIRSNDDLIFKYVISPTGGAADNVVINHTLTNAIWQETFPFCNNADQISADRFTLKCVLGYLNSTLNLTTKAWTHAHYNTNGAQVTSNISVTSDNSPTVTTTAQTLTISSNPKYHLIQGNMWGTTYYQQQISQKGPDNTTDGIMYTPFSSIKIQGGDNTGPGSVNDVKGNAVPSSMSYKVKFEDADTGLPIPTLQSYTWGSGINACDFSPYSFANIGDINCNQASAGGDITVNVSNYRSDTPINSSGHAGFGCAKICDPINRENNLNSLNPAVFANFQQSLFVMDNYTSRVWIPNSAISSAAGQQLNIKQTVYDLQVTAPSAVAPIVQTNRVAPIDDSYIRPDYVDRFRTSEFIGINGISFVNSIIDINNNRNSNHFAFIYPTITGTISRVYSGVGNGSITPINNGTLCQKWDKALYEFSNYTLDNYFNAVNYSFLTANPGIIEYATTQASNLNTAECADSDGPWYSSIAAVPGGKANISKVRTRNIQNLGFNQAADFNIDLIVKDNPIGTIVQTYTSFQSPGFNNGIWGHQQSSDPKVGGNYDSLRAISNKSVGGNGFEKLNGATYLAGQTAKFKTYNSYFTQKYTTFNPSTSTLISEVTLPVGVSYVPGSAKIAEGRGAYSTNPSVNPTSVVTNPTGATTIQWSLVNYELGFNQGDYHTNIVFDADFSNTIADNTQTYISSRVMSPEQPGCLPYSFNCSNNAITVYKVKDVYTELSVPSPFSQVNTPFSFDMRYGNGSIGTIDYDSIVKLKPSGQGSSIYSGDIDITNVTVSNGETVYYSATATSNDPTDSTNLLPSVNWTTNQASLGNTIKAFRIVKTGLAPSATSSNLVNVTVTPTGNKTGDKYQTEAFYRYTGATGLYGSNSTLNNIAGGSLSGIVFNNYHLPLVKDTDESGLAGVQMSLAGPVTGLTTTDANGLYKFENLPSGTYTVTAVVPTGYAATLDKDGSSNTFNVTSQGITFSPTIGANSFADLDFGLSDSLAPNAPTITTPVTIEDTNKVAYSITGTCEPLATVTVAAGTVTTTSICQTNSTYAVVLDVTTLPDGSVTIKVKQTDQTGNVSPETTSFALKVPPCTNGSNSPTTGCGTCPIGQQYVGNTCVSNCTNGALNPSSCNQCPAGQVYVATSNTTGSCVANCNNGASNPPSCLVTCTTAQVFNATLNSCVFICSNGTTNPVECNTCPSGQNFVNNACVSNCTNGATNPSTCNVCPAGQTYNGSNCITSCANGANNPPSCTTICPAGQTYNFVSNTCIANCTNGATNSPTCNTCPFGQSYSIGTVSCVTDCNNGATNPSSCNICPAAKFLNSSNNQCTPCPAGSSCVLGSTEPLPCPAGSYCLPSVVLPTPCDQGTYCPTSTTTPVLCSIGNVCTTPGTQTPCTLGNYCPSGSTVQTPCAIGSVCITPSTQTPCAAGSYCPLSTSVEQSCPAGSYCPTPSTKLPCTSGNYCPPSTVEPIPCVAGSICPASSSTPTLCAAGNYCPAGAIVEVGCLGGSYCTNPATQVLCTAGTYCPPSTVTPIICTGGVVCPAGSVTQTPCDAGYYCPVGSTAQNPCVTGSYCPPGSITQNPCAAGNYCTTPITQVPCTAGNFCPQSATAPTPCQAGTICPPSSSSETPCGAGSYCPAGAIFQVSCVVGSYCTTPATQIVCTAGNYCPIGSTIQTPCLVGNYCTTPTTQTPCLVGNYCPTSSTVQTPCLVGNYCSTPAVQVACSTGTYCPISTITPSQCLIGNVCTTPATQVPCPLGSYCPTSTSVVSPCTAGSFCTTSGTQVPCTEGNFCAAGSVSPTQCPANTYCTPGLAAPLTCPLNKLSLPGSKNIADCLAPSGGVIVLGSGSNSSSSSSSNSTTSSITNTIIQQNTVVTQSSSAISANTTKPDSYIAKSVQGSFRNKLEISDPYICGEGSYGNIPNPEKFGVKYVFYDFYKVGQSQASYKFKLNINANGDFFLPINKTTNTIEDGNYRVVFYAFDNEGNKAEGEYTDYISMNCNIDQTNKVIKTIKKSLNFDDSLLQSPASYLLTRSGGGSINPLIVFAVLVLLAYLSSNIGKKKNN